MEPADHSSKIDPKEPSSYASARRRLPFQRGKFLLGWLLIVGIAAWLAWTWYGDPRGTERYAPGPVAHAHAMWEAQCQACHEPWTPMSSGNWLGALNDPHGLDAKCQTCHAGPPHHANQKLDATPGCTACHREHTGRDARLSRVPDSACVACHKDVQAHAVDKSNLLAVTAFDVANHPEFRLVREKLEDPGRLKFNHKLHMTHGLAANTGQPLFTLDDGEDKQRGRYRSVAANGKAAIQLDCQSCHQLDRPIEVGAEAGEPALGLMLPPRAAGDYYLPVNYERHCSACHPLTVGAKELQVKVPHRRQPAALRPILEGHFTALFLKDQLRPLDPPFVPLPGKLPGLQLDKKKAVAVIQDKVRRAEMELYLGKKICGECHFFDPRPAAVAMDDFSKLQVEPVQVPALWFKSARFDHAAHRALDCRECHAGAFAEDNQGQPNQPASTKNLDILLPGIGTCLQCHGPQAESDAKVRGGARFDCVECHRYHHADRPHHGPGAAARGPAGKTLTIEELLNVAP